MAQLYQTIDHLKIKKYRSKNAKYVLELTLDAKIYNYCKHETSNMIRNWEIV